MLTSAPGALVKETYRNIVLGSVEKLYILLFESKKIC